MTSYFIVLYLEYYYVSASEDFLHGFFAWIFCLKIGALDSKAKRLEKPWRVGNYTTLNSQFKALQAE